MIWPGTFQQSDSKLCHLGGVLLGVKMSTYIFTASVCVCVSVCEMLERAWAMGLGLKVASATCITEALTPSSQCGLKMT